HQLTAPTRRLIALALPRKSIGATANPAASGAEMNPVALLIRPTIRGLARQLTAPTRRLIVPVLPRKMIGVNASPLAHGAETNPAARNARQTILNDRRVREILIPNKTAVRTAIPVILR
ncbi:MAG: hypothetical protein WBF35_13250, partial [Candidatus Acidiferrales bacterium]